MISLIEMLLKYPSAMYCFIFGKRISCFLLCSIMVLYAHSALAFFSNDKIDDNFSFRSLRVEMPKIKQGGCYFEGEILNNSNITQESVTVTFYAYDFFDHSLWKQTVQIGIIDPFCNSRKGYHFRKKLSRCDMPAKFQFKVSGAKKKDTQKAFPDKLESKSKSKPKSKDSDSMDSSQKRAFGSVDSITTPDVPIRKYLITLTNGKKISTDSCREHDNIVYFDRDGGEVRISKDKVSEIRQQN